MNTIINHPQPAGDGGAPSWPPLPPPDITPVFTAVLEVAAAQRGLPYEPWWPPPGRGCPQAIAEAREARGRGCPLCGALPGAACQADPSGDHLARYLDAYTAGQLTRAFMAAVLGELVVITGGSVIPDGAS
jgi:hypothetical protein